MKKVPRVSFEVPPGYPQLEYDVAGDTWVPRGDVIRGIVGDGGPDGEATVEIDGRRLSLRELGRMLTSHAGWGMRLVFVPAADLFAIPTIELRDLDEPEAGRTSPGPRPAKRKPASATMAARDMVTQRMPIFQLRITLEGVTPPIWRTVLASGNLSLKKLHRIIQITMGWTDSHLHQFASADGKDVASDPRFGLDHARDEGKVKLRSFAPEVGSRFRYEYDFGDSWQHEIVVEEIRSPQGVGRTPRCTDGARACPPEDCGGGPGYADLVESMQDPEHPERTRLLDWLGEPFEAEAFDLDSINEQLRRLP